MERSGPTTEHVRLCLQLILQAHLHQLDAGLTNQKVLDICSILNMHKVPPTHAERLKALQVIAAQVLPQMN